MVAPGCMTTTTSIKKSTFFEIFPKLHIFSDFSPLCFILAQKSLSKLGVPFKSCGLSCKPFYSLSGCPRANKPKSRPKDGTEAEPLR